MGNCVHEVDEGNIVGKRCLCRLCGRIQEATFNFDYYPTKEKDAKGRNYLMCERCMMNRAFTKKEPVEPVIPNNIMAMAEIE
jgi:hypothetical protein